VHSTRYSGLRIGGTGGVGRPGDGLRLEVAYASDRVLGPTGGFSEQCNPAQAKRGAVPSGPMLSWPAPCSGPTGKRKAAPNNGSRAASHRHAEVAKDLDIVAAGHS